MGILGQCARNAASKGGQNNIIQESIWAEVVRVLADQIIEVPDHVETTTGWAYSVAVAPRIEPRPYFSTDDFLKAVHQGCSGVF